MIKEELMGLNALKDGLKDGGVKVLTNFPGFYSQKLFEKLGGKETSINEKTAYEIAWGSSLGGKRSAVMFKNVGLNNAADPFLNSLLVGVNAGLVLIIFDDTQVQGSQSRQDSRHYNDFFGGLWLEPYDLQSAYDLAYNSFEWSEKTQMPVVIRVTNQLINYVGEYKRKKQKKSKKKLILDNKKFVIHPINWVYQLKRNNNGRKKVEMIVESINRKLCVTSDKKKIALFFGCNKVEENDLDDDFEKLQIATYPLPKKFIFDKCKNKEKILCFEQGDKYSYEKIKTMFNTLNVEGNFGFIPDNSNNYIVYNGYEKLFSSLKSLKPDIIVGDLGLYTKDSLDTIDACLSFGSSLAVGCGLLLSGIKKVVSIIGDGAYLHSGKDVIPEAILKNLNLKVIVICNGGSQTTGGQIIPGDIFYQPKNVTVNKVFYNKVSQKEIAANLRNILINEGVSILYIVI